MKKKLYAPGLALALFVSLAFFTGCPTDAENPPETPDDLVDSKWTWEGLILTFTTGDIAELSSESSGAYRFYYLYTYDRDTKKGRIVYDATINTSTPENPANLGDFTISNNYTALVFAQYKDYPHGADFVRVPESLVGTTWRWDSGGYGIRSLRFLSDGVVQFQDQFGDEKPWCDYDYSYIPETKKGIIGTALDKSNSIQSRFTVNNNNTHLIFTQWKSYPHGADYTRLKE